MRAVGAGGMDGKAGEIAATEIVTIERVEEVQRAAQLMGEHECSHLIVTDPDSGRPLGVRLKPGRGPRARVGGASVEQGPSCVVSTDRAHGFTRLPQPTPDRNVQSMTTQTTNTNRQRVLIAGGGVAALETVLALHELAPELTDVTVIAPNPDFHYRPMTVREPFAQGQARRYPLAPIVSDAGARLVTATSSHGWTRTSRIAHTKGDEQLEYDALVLALGAKAIPRYRHAVTIDAAHMDEILHGVIQDVEGGYIKSLAFVAPGRMAWPLPLYELALMTAGRAYDMNVDARGHARHPRGRSAGDLRAERERHRRGAARASNIQTIHSAYAEVPRRARW